MIDTITPISKVKYGNVEIPLIGSDIEVNEYDQLLSTGDYGYKWGYYIACWAPDKISEYIAQELLGEGI